MNAREYLNQLNTLRINIRICEEKIQKLKLDMICPPAINYDKLDVKTSPENRMDSYEVKKEALEHEWRMLKEIYITREAEIVQQIMSLDNPEYVQVLTEYYDKCVRPLWRVGEHMHYSERHVKRIHRDALAEFTKRFL